MHNSSDKNSRGPAHDLAVMLEHALFTPFLITSLAGTLLVVFAHCKKIRLLVVKTRPMEMVLWKQPI